MSKIVWWFLISTASMVVLTMVTLPDNNLHIVTCDVGQGDSILIYQGFTQVLVDGGPNDRVMDCLRSHIPWYDRKIEVLVLSHPQQDHMKGLLEVVDSFEIGIFLSSNVSNTSDTFKRFYSKVLVKKIKVLSPEMGDEILIGNLRFKTMWPEEKYGNEFIWSDDFSDQVNQGVVLGAYDGDLNEQSVVLEMTYQDISLLLTGDIGTREEQALIRSGVITEVDVLKVAHHGSKFSSGSDFIEATRPKWALISVGENNRFGHPTRDVLMYLDIVGSQVLRTDELGEIELVSDGKEIWIGN